MLIPQNMPLFLDLGATEQTVVFSRLLHLDLWDDAIKPKQASCKTRVTAARHEVDTLTSRLEEVEVSVTTYQQKTDSWAKEQHREAAHQQGQVNAATIAVNTAKT